MGRTLHLANPWMSGPDVLALQTALAAAKLYKGELDGKYGASTAHSCEVAKWRLGYPKSGIHPHYETAGPLLLAYLRGHKRLPAAYILRRRTRLGKPAKTPVDAPTKAETKEQAMRAAAVDYWHAFLLPHERDVHYGEVRPMRAMDKLELLPITEDCSTAVTKGAKAGGFRDPNGLFFRGDGYTGTMLSRCRRISQHQVQPADLVVFVNPRQPSGHHVCQVLEVLEGGEMTLGSHGRESDPRSVSLSQEAASQAHYGATECHFLQVAA